MSGEPTPIQAACAASIKHESSVRNSSIVSVPPIYTLTAPSNIPPVMAWNSYVGLNNHSLSAQQTVGTNTLIHGIPRHGVPQTVHRTYPTGFHTSAPVYGASTVEIPVRTDHTTIRQTHSHDMNSQLRSSLATPVRNTPPPSIPSTVHTSAIPSNVHTPAIPSTVHMVDAQPMITISSGGVNSQIVPQQLIASMQGDSQMTISMSLDMSKLQEMQNVLGPNTHLTVVQNLANSEHHHIIPTQAIAVEPPHNVEPHQEVVSYSLVTHPSVIVDENINAGRLTIQSANSVPTSQSQLMAIQGHTMSTRSSADKASHPNLPPVVKRGRPESKGKSPRKSTATKAKTVLSADGDVIKVIPKYSPHKLKRKAYSIREKLRSVEKVKSGESRSKILRDLGIPDSTLRGWIKDEEKLRTFAFNVDVKKKKARTAKDTLLDSVLYSWYLQQKDRGMNVSGSTLKMKADELNRDINGENNFKASAGWLYRFQKRHNIGKHKDEEETEEVVRPTSSKEGTDETLHFPYDQSAKIQDTTGVNPNVVLFCEKLKDYIIGGGYREEQIYTCDETGFFYKLLPDNTLLVPSDEPSCVNSKRIRDRITILFCANKSGSHKLKPLCVGKFRSPRGFQHVNISKLPFSYKCSHNACMTPSLFKEWFLTNFVPEVKQQLGRLKIEDKALLLLKENAAHPTGEYLSSPDNTIQVLFLPKESAMLLQPFEQGILAAFKTNYRLELINEVNNCATNVKMYLRHLSLRTMMTLGDKAWTSIKPREIEKAWHKSLPNVFEAYPDNGEVTDVVVIDKTDLELVFQGKLEASGIETSLHTIKEWRNLNENLPVADLDGNEDNVQLEETPEALEGPVPSDDDNQSKVPSNAEAVTAFEIGLQWLESKNIDYITILQVQSILDYARYERRNELSQLNNC